jgi:hypothetical protein
MRSSGNLKEGPFSFDSISRQRRIVAKESEDAIFLFVVVSVENGEVSFSIEGFDTELKLELAREREIEFSCEVEFFRSNVKQEQSPVTRTCQQSFKTVFFIYFLYGYHNLVLEFAIRLQNDLILNF